MDDAYALAINPYSACRSHSEVTVCGALGPAPHPSKEGADAGGTNGHPAAVVPKWTLFVIVGCLTRGNSALLVGMLGFAIIQNLLASRDPQLAILYMLVVLALAMMAADDFQWTRGCATATRS